MLELRSYREGDAPSVRRLHDEGLREAGAHAGDGPWDDDLRAIRATYLDDDGEFLVGLLDAEIVAIGGLRRVSGAVAEVKRMRVDAGHRRRGFARAVLDRLEVRARELGYRTLRLDTTLAQEPARRLYESAGYCEIGRTEDPVGETLLVFEKRLAQASSAPR